MNIACLCPTYLRPELLGELIECFLRQDYPLKKRELIILDDAGQYNCMSGPGWRLISIPNRFSTLGAKYNALASLASPWADAFAVWEDDDIYLPWAFTTVAKALARGKWARPSQVFLSFSDGTLGRYRAYPEDHPDRPGYHSGWAYRREAFEAVRGYRRCELNGDVDIRNRLLKRWGSSVDPIEDHPDPYLIHRRNPGTYSGGLFRRGEYQKLSALPKPKIGRLYIRWDQLYDKLSMEPLPARTRPVQ